MPSSRVETRPAAETWFVWGVCGLLALVVWLIYGQTLHYELLDFDDSGFVSANPHVNHGLTVDGIKWAFEEGPFGEWYPLAPLSHMLDCQLFGLAAWGHHLTNLLLHAATSIGLFLVWRRMTRELLPSAFVAAIFAVHPQHVESVAWVSERRDVLSGLFFVLTLAAYAGFVRHGRSFARYCLVFALLALGLMAKPMLVTVPALLLLLDFWPLARFGSAGNLPAEAVDHGRLSVYQLVLEKMPLFALAIGDCLLTLRTHNHPAFPRPWSARIGNAAVSCVTYMVQFFYPVDLIAFYPMPEGGRPAGEVVGALVILAGICAAAVLWRRRFPFLFVGWFWFLGMLMPVIGLVQVADHAMADRYMYLPSIGLSIAIVWGLSRLAAGSPAIGRLLAVGWVVALAVFVALAHVQASYWRDDETLFRRALQIAPDNAMAECAVADALAREGRNDEAIALYERAKRHPRDAAPFNNLGSLLRHEGRVDEAIVEFLKALDVNPDYFLARRNLGAVLLEKGEIDAAVFEHRRAVEIDPRDAIARIALARGLALQGHFDESYEQLQRAVQLDPYNADAYNDWGSSLFRQGKVQESLSYFQRALSLAPKALPSYYNLAAVLVALGRPDEALDLYRQALELKPGDEETLRRLDKLKQKLAAPRD